MSAMQRPFWLVLTALFYPDLILIAVAALAMACLFL